MAEQATHLPKPLLPGKAEVPVDKVQASFGRFDDDELCAPRGLRWFNRSETSCLCPNGHRDRIKFP